MPARKRSLDLSRTVKDERGGARYRNGEIDLRKTRSFDDHAGGVIDLRDGETLGQKRDEFFETMPAYADIVAPAPARSKSEQAEPAEIELDQERQSEASRDWSDTLEELDQQFADTWARFRRHSRSSLRRSGWAISSRFATATTWMRSHGRLWKILAASVAVLLIASLILLGLSHLHLLGLKGAEQPAYNQGSGGGSGSSNPSGAATQAGQSSASAPSSQASPPMPPISSSRGGQAGYANQLSPSKPVHSATSAPQPTRSVPSNTTAGGRGSSVGGFTPPMGGGSPPTAASPVTTASTTGGVYQEAIIQMVVQPPLSDPSYRLQVTSTDPLVELNQVPTNTPSDDCQEL
jgi:hypothetical protein